MRLGVEHEQRTNRFSLPKQVSYIKDHEEGESALRIKQIQQSLLDNFKVQYEDRLRVKFISFISLDFKMDRFIQISDLFTGTINRKLNVQGDVGRKTNAKDDITEHILEAVGLKIINYSPELFDQYIEDETIDDMATLYVFD
ncbi:hypothetical protein GCM10011351_06550 [Paraliobacillus quinghaiensis]|uniref:Uncharacterized protein n=1 Tax=Paraliobacillus quinghaiensis TaxID=470815 RepID=A0A917WQM2_9BACI|nr:hypothetical protein [Paraliobacillus quinghaiensis]GGM23463.1 hypothetical protein GCM10011351_06550 [Paraliobacillus quinghaiensis]